MAGKWITGKPISISMMASSRQQCLVLQEYARRQIELNAHMLEILTSTDDEDYRADFLVGNSVAGLLPTGGSVQIISDVHTGGATAIFDGIRSYDISGAGATENTPSISPTKLLSAMSAERVDPDENLEEMIDYCQSNIKVNELISDLTLGAIQGDFNPSMLYTKYRNISIPSVQSICDSLATIGSSGKVDSVISAIMSGIEEFTTLSESISEESSEVDPVVIQSWETTGFWQGFWGGLAEVASSVGLLLLACGGVVTKIIGASVSLVANIVSAIIQRDKEEQTAPTVDPYSGDTFLCHSTVIAKDNYLLVEEGTYYTPWFAAWVKRNGQGAKMCLALRASPIGGFPSSNLDTSPASDGTLNGYSFYPLQDTTFLQNVVDNNDPSDVGHAAVNVMYQSIDQRLANNCSLATFEWNDASDITRGASQWISALGYLHSLAALITIVESRSPYGSEFDHPLLGCRFKIKYGNGYKYIDAYEWIRAMNELLRTVSAPIPLYKITDVNVMTVALQQAMASNGALATVSQNFKLYDKAASDGINEPYLTTSVDTLGLSDWECLRYNVDATLSHYDGLPILQWLPSVHSTANSSDYGAVYCDYTPGFDDSWRPFFTPPKQSIAQWTAIQVTRAIALAWVVASSVALSVRAKKLLRRVRYRRQLKMESARAAWLDEPDNPFAKDQYLKRLARLDKSNAITSGVTGMAISSFSGYEAETVQPDNVNLKDVQTELSQSMSNNQKSTGLQLEELSMGLGQVLNYIDAVGRAVVGSEKWNDILTSKTFLN